MATKKPDPVPTRAELLELLGIAARKGNVPAMRLLLQYHDAVADDAGDDFIDELARKREHGHG